MTVQVSLILFPGFLQEALIPCNFYSYTGSEQILEALKAWE